MNRSIIPMLVLIAWTTSLSAQITREQADKIVLEHLQNEVTLPYLLYVYDHAPNTEGIMITTYNEETTKVKYACWVYYVNEKPEVSEPTQHRYLFVKEDNGNLLEIITSNDLGADLTDWEPMLGLVDMKKEVISIYPNPTTGVLNFQKTIKNEQLTIKGIEIFDIYGKTLLSYKFQSSSLHTLNISHLKAGVYFVKIKTENGKQIQKIIKL